MKKSYLGFLIAIFLLFGPFLGGKAFCRLSTAVTGAKNGAVAISSRVKPARARVCSLPTALKSVLSKTLGADNPRYRLSRSDRGYRAVNARNRLRAIMGLNGFTVRSGANEWGLRLTAWGRGRRLQKLEAGRVVSASNRVAVNRGGITEWWVNGPLGIEQGWTVANRPRREKVGGKLTLLLSQSGDLRAQALSHGNSVCVSNKAGRQILRYAGLSAYDKTGRQLPAHFEATRQIVRVVVDDAGAVYPVRIDPWVQAAKLTPSDSVASDLFGAKLALSSDGATLAVAIHSLQSVVYVFKKPASGWANATETARLTPSNRSTETLGESVAVTADGSTIFTGGTYQADGAQVAQGAVYVFKEPASGWADENEAAMLTTSAGGDAQWFGYSIAVTPDGATLVAGNFVKTLGGNYAQGAVYVFKEPASGWANENETAMLTASDGGSDDTFGSSVAITPDGATIVVGSPGGTIIYYGGTPPVQVATSRGAVYVFEKPASGWADGHETAKLTGPGGSTYYMGYSVAVSADGTTVVSGAGGIQVNNVLYPGRVCVFKEPATGWVNENQTADLTASDLPSSSTDLTASCDLGKSVAITPDGGTVLAGAPCTQKPGAVYVFKEPATGWANEIETAELTASDGVTADSFGSAVAVSPDGATLVVGASGQYGIATLSGSVYVFQGPFWAGATSTGNGWYYLSPFGAFTTGSSPWIYHQTLGWLYPVSTSTENIWFYDPRWDGTGGWWWTSSSFFPWLYSTTENEWLYYDAKDSSVAARWFFTTGGKAATH